MKFLKSKGVILSLICMLLYGIIVFFIYYIGYQPIPKQINQLPISIVNEDKENSQFKTSLKKSLNSFDTIHENSNLKHEINNLKDRKTFMIIDIPKDFNKNIKKNKPVKLSFYINEANQSIVTTSLKTIANNIGNTVNNKIIVQKGKVILTHAITKQLQQQNKASLREAQNQLATLPPAQRKKMAEQLNLQQQKAKKQISDQVNKTYQGIDQSVITSIHRINKVNSGLNNSMAPFFISLASYLAALLSALLLYGTFVKISEIDGKFKSFGYLEIAMALLSIFGGLIVSITLISGTGLSWHNLGNIFLIHSLEIFAAINLNEILMLLIGQIGSSINIFLTMLQVVASAGMVPVQIMNGFFKAIHTFSPMYYSVMADYDLLYGNLNSTNLYMGILSIIALYMIINLIIVATKNSYRMLDFKEIA